MTRTRFVCVLALALLLAGLLAACSDRGPAEDPAAPAGTAIAKDAHDDSQAYLAWIYAQSHDDPPPGTSYTYELAASGTISVADGGAFSGSPASWPSGTGSFMYYVPPGAIDPASLDDPGATEITIEIWVPVYDTVFPCPDADMPMILEPALAYHENTPATMWVSYHPALAPTCLVGGYFLYPVDQDAGSGTYSVPYVNQGTVEAQAQAKGIAPPILIRPDPPEPDPCAIGIECPVLHHSRWALSKDDPEGGGTPGAPWEPQDPCGG